MDQREHALEQSWTNLLRKDAKGGGDSKRRSWWQRKDPPAPAAAKQHKDTTNICSDSASAEYATYSLRSHLHSCDHRLHADFMPRSQNGPDQGVVPVHDSVDNQIDSIPLGDQAAPQPPVLRKTAKSEGSVGKSFIKLSINDQQVLNSLRIAAGTKRAAEPSGQIPEGETRPSKRAPPQSTLADDIQRKMTTNITAQKATDVGVKLEPGVLHLPKPLPSKALTQTSSNAALYTKDDYLEPGGKMLLQPETRPITQDQLVNEVKGIYAGLVMVEKKCVEIDQQQSKTTSKLSDEQWQALIALHRTLLYEHHDFFLASQHPSSSAALRRLATKYALCSYGRTRWVRFCPRKVSSADTHCQSPL